MSDTTFIKTFPIKEVLARTLYKTSVNWELIDATEVEAIAAGWCISGEDVDCNLTWDVENFIMTFTKPTASDPKQN